MPRTIDEGFRDLLSKLTPSSTESAAAKSHRTSIKGCLETNYSMTNFFKTGSFGNGTSISGYSDVDYFAVIPTESHKQDSGTNLTVIKNTLTKRFPDTGVRVDCPTVVLPFGTDAKESTEVVPADYKRKTNGYNVYEIADCSGDWMDSSPTTHKAYIKEQDDRLSGKLRPLIRFIKAWKFYRNVKISSFYLELRVAKLMQNESSIVYSIDINTIISWLYDNDLPAIQDPKGVSGLINPCKTKAQKTDAISKLGTAKTRVANARSYEEKKGIKNAFYYWDLFFDSKFPSYYK
ncbi:MAG: nucleotidyltransferase [Pseudomonadota bacterium]